MNIEIVACVTQDNAIGKGDKLLYHIKEDLKRFKELTAGQIVVMGRKTLESIVKMNGRPLPNRVNVVLTRDRNYQAPRGVFVFHSVEDIIKSCKTRNEKDKKIMICGGEKVYEEFLPYTDIVHLTRVLEDSEDADIYYPFELQQELGFQNNRQSHTYYSEEEDVLFYYEEYVNLLKKKPEI